MQDRPDAPISPSTEQSARSQHSRRKFNRVEIRYFMLLGDSGVAPSFLCSRYGFTLAEFFRWKAKYEKYASPRPPDELGALKREVALLRAIVDQLLQASGDI